MQKGDVGGERAGTYGQRAAERTASISGQQATAASMRCEELGLVKACAPAVSILHASLIMHETIGLHKVLMLSPPSLDVDETEAWVALMECKQRAERLRRTRPKSTEEAA